MQTLEDAIAHFQKIPTALTFDYNGGEFKGKALPVSNACREEICEELEITLNDEYRGILKHKKKVLEDEDEPDKKFVKAIAGEG